MKTITASATVAATPERVWEVLSDFDGISQSAPHIDEAAIALEQATGVGTARQCDFTMCIHSERTSPAGSRAKAIASTSRSPALRCR